MPYIQGYDREQMERLKLSASNAGELNYKITLLLIEYLEENGKNYQKMNDVMGALEGAKLEFYRRIAAPYEDQKIKENGDVY